MSKTARPNGRKPTENLETTKSGSFQRLPVIPWLLSSSIAIGSCIPVGGLLWSA
jgi:hypothetical protein